MHNKSLWQLHSPANTIYPALDAPVETEILIIGAGITGLTAAAQLTAAGKKVTVVERGRVGGLVTSHSSAHLSTLLDTCYHEIAGNFDEEGAKTAAQAVAHAIDHIEEQVKKYNIDCGFRRVDGYLYTEDAAGTQLINKEAEAARRAGLEVFQEAPALPFPVQAGIRVARQAQMDPVAYTQALARQLHTQGCQIYEHTTVTWIEETSPLEIQANGHIVKAGKVLMATHTPLSINPVQAEVFPFISYCIAIKTSHAHKLNGLYADTAQPYHYIRDVEAPGQQKLLVIGGADHKTGTVTETEQHYNEIIAYARERFPDMELVTKWSGQYYKPADGLPYVGHSAMRQNVWLATGYSGDGLTWGTAAGLLVARQMLDQADALGKLISATRLNLVASAPEMIRENFHSFKQLILDRLTDADVKSLNQLAPGEGNIVQLEGKKLAVYRQEDGSYYAMSPECHHLGCYVRWNKAEKTWDCPCHGSRFTALGEVLYPPVLHGMTGKFLDV